MELIAAGGHADVYRHNSHLPQGERRIIKAIHMRSQCDNEITELAIQTIVYDDIMAMKTRKPVSNFEKLIKTYAVVPKPISFENGRKTIGNKSYECSVMMEALAGIPARAIAELASGPECPEGALENIEAGYMEAHPTWSPFVHLSMNAETPEGFYGKTSGKISDENPARGYVLGSGRALLHKLRDPVLTNNLNLPALKLSDKEISDMIGYLYANMLYHALIIPLDVEFLLGIRDGNYIVAVLDFGLAIDMQTPETWGKNPVYAEILSGGLDDRKVDLLRSAVIADLSADIYCSLDHADEGETYSGLDGWERVENEFEDVYTPFKRFYR